MKTILTSKTDQNEEEEVKVTKNIDSLPNKLLACFSLKRNLPSLVSTLESEEIKCLHGLKAISIILLFLSLKLIPMGIDSHTQIAINSPSSLIHLFRYFCDLLFSTRMFFFSLEVFLHHSVLSKKFQRVANSCGLKKFLADF